ncbi:MAG: alpha/beta hydrolase [Clostridia bacterium]|nr:alpha/beta hydrolase [Clostridia bacterium]
MEQGFIKSFDNAQIYVYAWTDVKKPKGIVQIFHGMSEHAKRYDDFAKFLNSQGYLVFADDHRAHGKTAGSVSLLGKYKNETNLFYDTLLDELFISELLTKEYNLPLYVFGHSYGSFLCQAYIQKSAFYKKAIMCGSALMKNRIDIKFGKFIAKLTARFKGKDAPAKLVEKCSFGAYNKKVKRGSWLNTDSEEVKKYQLDPYCGQPFSAKFYVDFFTTFDWIYTKEHTRKIDLYKPLLLIAGKDDPVGSMGKSVADLFKFYTGLEVKNLKMHLYKDARHEILNEPAIKQQVYKDVLNFIEEEDLLKTQS